MHVLILRPYRKDNIYFRTIEEREKINIILYALKPGFNDNSGSILPFSALCHLVPVVVAGSLYTTDVSL